MATLHHMRDDMCDTRNLRKRPGLEAYHDQIMIGLNGKFWSALKPGSKLG